MYTEQAIRKSVEGGWKIPHVETPDELPSAIQFYTKEWQKVVCNPSFWSCLGTELGWIWEWHHFIDHLASGGTPEEFFKSLLQDVK